MSIDIGWRPVTNDFNHFSASNDLYKILEDEFGIPSKIGDSKIEFLRGLLAAGHKDCFDLIEAIREYGQIEIKKFINPLTP